MRSRASLPRKSGLSPSPKMRTRLAAVFTLRSDIAKLLVDGLGQAGAFVSGVTTVQPIVTRNVH